MDDDEERLVVADGRVIPLEAGLQAQQFLDPDVLPVVHAPGGRHGLSRAESTSRGEKEKARSRPTLDPAHATTERSATERRMGAQKLQGAAEFADDGDRQGDPARPGACAMPGR